MDYLLEWSTVTLIKQRLSHIPTSYPHPFPFTAQRWKSKLFPAGPCAIWPQVILQPSWPHPTTTHLQPGPGYTGHSCLSETYCPTSLPQRRTARTFFSPSGAVSICTLCFWLGSVSQSWFHVTYLLMPLLAILSVIRGCCHILWFNFLPRKLTSLVLIVYLYILCFSPTKI